MLCWTSTFVRNQNYECLSKVNEKDKAAKFLQKLVFYLKLSRTRLIATIFFNRQIIDTFLMFMIEKLMLFCFSFEYSFIIFRGQAALGPFFPTLQAQNTKKSIKNKLSNLRSMNFCVYKNGNWAMSRQLK